MQRRYFFLSIFILVSILAGCAPRASAPLAAVKTLDSSTSADEPEFVPHDSPASCPITQSPQIAFIPPAPFPSEPPERYTDEFWYGTPELWTILGTEGTWYALPHDKGGYSQKVFWWSQSFDVGKDPYPPLRVTMERLDTKATPVVAAEEAANASADFGTAMLTGVEIPGLGCWKITGEYKEAALSFVVRVAP